MDLGVQMPIDLTDRDCRKISQSLNFFHIKFSFYRFRYNFPFVPNPINPPLGGLNPTFAPVLPIDPRINSLSTRLNFNNNQISNDRLNSLLNILLNARNLTTEATPNILSN